MIRGLFNRNVYLQYDAEILLCGDLPSVLGINNVFSFGKYLPHYFHDTISEFCPYPSCCKTPEPIFLKKNELKSVLNKIDALIVSSRASERGQYAITEAKKIGLPIAIIDVQDHELIYGSSDIENQLCRNFSYNYHYDLYFKKDLPLGYKTDTIVPLAPTPVRPESHHFIKLKKKYDIFYSGRKRASRCQDDRAQMAKLLKNKFNKILFKEHDSRNTFLPIRDYWENVSNSRITLSPSGRSWDSFRHCEVGLSESTALLAPKPYIETIQPLLEDGENSILYDTEIQNGRYGIIHESDIVDKIGFYLNNLEKLTSIAKKWNQDVVSGHTIFARSKYIINVMKQSF